jgi:hypothetical protein
MPKHASLYIRRKPSRRREQTGGRRATREKEKKGKQNYTGSEKCYT